MNAEILVAGGTGLVGANLTQRLKGVGARVVSTKYKNKNQIFDDCLRYDFKNYSDCIESTKNKDAVVICAGEFHGVQKKTETVESLL